jgi:hypothetical protein
MTLKQTLGVRKLLVEQWKETRDEIAPLLARIFRESLRTGVVPRDWKEAKVVPIFKKGSKTSAGNYRPVSLTSICCRIMEGMIRDEISEHLHTNRLLHPSQHGFMKNKSAQRTSSSSWRK